ncbi:MAG: hypothetical protein ACRDY6_11145 [Acidimicrobiia bacterium]
MRKTSPCGQQEARFRLDEARAHLEQARAVAHGKPGTAWPNVAASIAVLAGIAASDAVCCARAGRRSAGDSHDEATKLLRAALPKERHRLVHLGRLLAVKTPAQYGGRPISARKAMTAIEQAAELVDAADALIV